LNGVSLDIAPGKTTVIIGPSGCGKSVLLKHIVALLRPDRGRVYFREQEITHLNEHDLVPIRRKMGFLFQGGALFDSMTVEQNIIFPLTEHKTGTPAQRRERCRQVLSMVGLDGIQDKMPDELSGGQRKRVALARALSLDPEVILYDEPTTGLDPIQLREIRKLIRELGENHGVILSTHLLAEVQAMCSHVQIMNAGRLVYASPLAALQQQSTRLRIGLNAPPPISNLVELPGVEHAEALGDGRFRLFHAPDFVPYRAVVEQSCAKGWDLWELTPEYADLERIFVELTLGEKATE